MLGGVSTIVNKKLHTINDLNRLEQ